MDVRPHIVVVEDEATQRQLLVDYLAKHNFRVSGAEDGIGLRRLVGEIPLTPSDSWRLVQRGPLAQ